MIRSHQRGLTFIEIMIVIVILGVLVAVVAPNMSGPRASIALRSGARNIAGAGMLARQMAISTGDPTYLMIYPETQEWRIKIYPDEEEEDRGPSRRKFSRKKVLEEIGSSEERLQGLPQEVRLEKLQRNDAEIDLDEEEIVLTFYPTGSCSGMAIQIMNSREKSLTIDFDRVTGRPEIYKGKPKSFAMKLKEHGLDPRKFGLEDDSMTADADEDSKHKFYMSAGWNEEERVDYYKDIAERLMSQSRLRARVREEGVSAYYTEAQRWGN